MEWDEFNKNPLNDKAKRDFLDKMTKRSKYMLSELTEEEKNSKLLNIHLMEFYGKG